MSTDDIESIEETMRVYVMSLSTQWTGANNKQVLEIHPLIRYLRVDDLNARVFIYVHWENGLLYKLFVKTTADGTVVYSSHIIFNFNMKYSRVCHRCRWV